MKTQIKAQMKQCFRVSFLDCFLDDFAFFSLSRLDARRTINQNLLFAALCAVSIFVLSPARASRLYAQSRATAQSSSAKSSSASDTSASVLPRRINFDILSIVADADKPLFLRYGVWGAAEWNNQNANFSTARGFESTAPRDFGWQDPLQILISPSASFGASLELPLVGRFGVGLRAAYSLLWSSFSQREALAPFRLSTNELVTGELEHRFSARLENIVVEPVLTFRLLDALTVHAGASIRYAPAPTFSSETASLGQTPPFDGGSRLRDVFQNQALPRSANFVDNLEHGLVGGLSYEIPLNATGTILFAPEIFYRHPLGSFLGTSSGDVAAEMVKADGSAGEWEIASLRLGAGLRWSPFRTIRPELTPELQEKIEELKRYDSLVTAERIQNEERLRQVDSINRVIMAKMEAMKKLGVIARITKVSGLDASGAERSPTTIEAEEFRTTVEYQLLPIIQFDERSAKIPLRYRAVQSAERAKFSFSQLSGKPPFEVYRHILNIIGKRMSETPTAVLYLAPSAGSDEENPAQMAERRAAAVSGYLQDVWKIAEKRLIIAKAQTSKQGAEARVVDLSANMPEILAPLTFDDVRRRIEPQKILIETEISVGQGLKQWRVEARQFQDNEDVLLKELQGGAEPPNVIEWAIADETATQPQSGQDVVVQLTVTDTKNINTESPLLIIPVRRQGVVQKEAQGDYRQMRNVTFVRVAESSLDEDTMQMIERLKSSLKNSSSVVVRYMTESGKANAQRLMQLCGLNAKTASLRQAPWCGLQQASETNDAQAYKGAVEVEMR
jgi:hypothetical protein